ncbi:hypothetical protein CR513_20709, partial [Mucuna pruriens]
MRDQSMSSPNQEPTPKYNNRPKASHYLFPPEQSWKVEINIPLPDAIKQVLKYAKFLKELCVQ